MRTIARSRRGILQSVAALALSPAALAQEGKQEGEKPDKDKPAKTAPKPEGDKSPPKPKLVTRDFSGTFHGERLTYTTTAGEIQLRNDKGDPTASIFHVAYVKKSAGENLHRPVAFVFNGGPGSSSLWLHLGLLGPKRVSLPEDGSNAGAAPYQLIDNAGSILDATDLVFIDPVGTGYSHALGDAKDEDFWGLQSDARSVASFIRMWLTQNGRWNAPKYLVGESYGTTRAAQVIQEIQTGYDAVTFNGVALVSSILDFRTLSFDEGNDVGYVSFLPTYAAAAWYHGKITPKPPALVPFLDEVRGFAGGEYLIALLKGSALQGAEREEVVKRLARYTGLSENYIRQSELRVNAARFMKELLRDQGKTLGRYDSRSLGEDRDAAGETSDADPSLYAVDGAFVASINDYLTRTLNVGIDRNYKILDMQPSSRWKWVEHAGPASVVNVAPHIGQAMRENRDFRLFVACGYFDLATPFYGSEITIANNGIKRERVQMQYFDAGHMMYTHGPSRDRLSLAIRDFIAHR